MFQKRGAGRFGGLVRTASIAVLIGFVACGDQKPKSAAPKSAAPEVAVPKFDVKKFSDPTRIDNKWLPIAPGTQLTYEGKVKGSEESFARRVVFTVTDATKVIDGVRTVVIWERDYKNDELAESEIAFFAQDDDGAVWLMGEYPEEYDGGKFQGAPSTWVAGLAEANAGILMPAAPRKGAPPYLQGLAPDVEFHDLAQVHKVGQESCVPAGCYKDVMVFDEWDPDAQPQDGHQLKFHAPGVGPVQVEAMGGEDQETLKLVKVEKLSLESLAASRQEALAHDQRAYGVVAKYKDTPPAA